MNVVGRLASSGLSVNQHRSGPPTNSAQALVSACGISFGVGSRYDAGSHAISAIGAEAAGLRFLEAKP